VCALIGDEAGEDGSHHGGIEHALPTVNQQGCQQKVVDEEEDQIDSKESPYQQYLRPVERQEAVVHRTDIHA
jgi:hypothetical protein